MQQFVVPQFIEVEDKIFGPITVRQFLILLAGGMAIFLSYRFADFSLFALLTAIIGGITLLFAFVKINGQTFHYFLLNLFQTLRRPSQRTWYKGHTDKELLLFVNEKPEEKEEREEEKKSHREHIRQLSLIVNTGGYYQGSQTPEEDLYEK